MQKCLLAHLREIGDPKCERVTSAPMLLKVMGHDRSNWYKWGNLQGFKGWWSRALEDQLTGDTLRRVHLNLAKLAQTQRDSSIIKLFLERFDKEYKPATRLEHSAAETANDRQIQAAIERSQERGRQTRAKQVESRVKDTANSLPASTEQPDKTERSENVNGSIRPEQADN